MPSESNRVPFWRRACTLLIEHPTRITSIKVWRGGFGKHLLAARQNALRLTSRNHSISRHLPFTYFTVDTLSFVSFACSLFLLLNLVLSLASSSTSFPLPIIIRSHYSPYPLPPHTLVITISCSPLRSFRTLVTCSEAASVLIISATPFLLAPHPGHRQTASSSPIYIYRSHLMSHFRKCSIIPQTIPDQSRRLSS